MKPRSKVRQLGPENKSSQVECIRELIVHPHVSLGDDFKLRLVRLDARSDEAQCREIDLAEFWLPANAIYSEPQSLVNRQTFAGTIVLVIDKYFQRARQSKSRHCRAAFIVTTLVKFFEYMWLRDIYELASVTQLDFDNLAKALAEGGWHKALNFRNRLDAALDAGRHSLSAKLLSLGRNHLRGVVPQSVKRHLGSNLIAREMAYYHSRILRSYEGRINDYAKSVLDKGDITPSGMGYSLLRQTLEAINLMLDLPSGFGVTYVPYPEPVRLAKRLGRPQTRTRNLGAIEAGLLIGEAFKWLYIYGPTIRELIAGICEQVALSFTAGREVLGYNLEEWLNNSPARRQLEEQLGMEIDGIDRGSVSALSVRKVFLSLLSACFVLIATMNARRRDEITHRKFGIHRGFTEVEDELLGLYKGRFYIEKTYQDYLEFYVNKTTRDAALLLESIQNIFDDLNRHLGRPLLGDSPAREQSLFGYHRFSRIEGVNPTRCWYQFESCRNGPTSDFLKRALGSQYLLGAHPHMFRRLYALVHMYQHEIPSLQALGQQLGHDSLSTTQVYVTDHAMREDVERIAAKIDRTGRMRSRMFAFHIAGIQKELNIIRDEKLIETVLSIISGQPASGGYPSYIRRFYRMASGHIDFSKLDLERQSQVLSAAVKKRGHVPNPMRHGQCMVGTQMPAPTARCYGPDGQTRPHNASPHTCAKCPFHYLNNAYLRNLEIDLDELDTTSADPSVTEFQRERARIDAGNLRIAILHHRERLGPLEEGQ